MGAGREWGPSADWGVAEQLLAALIEGVDALRKQMVGLWADPKKVSKRDLEPMRVPRPGYVPTWRARRGRPLTVGDIRSGRIGRGGS